jgi:iron(III) transport system substrate-binding protein
MIGHPRCTLALTLLLALAAALPATPALAQKQVVVIYTAIENEQITEYKKSYEKALPNLDVRMKRLSTGDISAVFMAEKDNMQADIIWGVAATNMLIFKNAGLLEPYAPKGLERIQPLFRDKANPPAWVGIDIYMSAFCFNTEVAKKHNLPKPESWADLTKPVYKGQVVMPNPASSGTGYLSVASILQRMGEAEGWKYLDALNQNIAEYTKSGSKPCKDAAAGERGVGVSFEYVAHEMKKKWRWCCPRRARATRSRRTRSPRRAPRTPPPGSSSTGRSAMTRCAWSRTSSPRSASPDSRCPRACPRT